MKLTLLLLLGITLLCAHQASARQGGPRERPQGGGAQEGRPQGGPKRGTQGGRFPKRRTPQQGKKEEEGGQQAERRRLPRPDRSQNDKCGINQMYIDCNGNEEIRCERECKERSENGPKPEKCVTECTDDFLCVCDRLKGYILRDDECIKMEECLADQRPGKLEGPKRPKGGPNRPEGGPKRPEGGPNRKTANRPEGAPKAVPEKSNLCKNPEVQMYIDCGTNSEIRCEPECKERSGDDTKPEKCTTTCTDGFVCVCNRVQGYILRDGVCVKRSECQAEEMPGKGKGEKNQIKKGQRPNRQEGGATNNGEKPKRGPGGFGKNKRPGMMGNRGGNMGNRNNRDRQ